MTPVAGNAHALLAVDGLARGLRSDRRPARRLAERSSRRLVRARRRERRGQDDAAARHLRDRSQTRRYGSLRRKGRYCAVAARARPPRPRPRPRGPPHARPDERRGELARSCRKLYAAPPRRSRHRWFVRTLGSRSSLHAARVPAGALSGGEQQLLAICTERSPPGRKCCCSTNHRWDSRPSSSTRSSRSSAQNARAVSRSCSSSRTPVARSRLPTWRT